MTKRKKFKPYKVGNRGYMPGKRQKMFRFPPRPKVKTVLSATNTQDGKVEQNLPGTDSTPSVPQKEGRTQA